MTTLSAYFDEDEPRFAFVEGERLPVIFEANVRRGRYTERLRDFGGRRDEFVNLADRIQRAVLARELGEDWHMIGVYPLSGIQTYDEPFECFLGARIARLMEVEAPSKKRNADT